MNVEQSRQEIRERRYTLFLLFMVAVLSYIDRTILSILQVPIKTELGLSDSQLGALTGLSFALFYATLALPIARLSDRMVRKNIVAASLAVWSGMTSLIGLASSFSGLALFRMGVAVGEAGSMPATQSMIADMCPPKSRATAFAILGLSLPVGLMLGYGGAGTLEKMIGWRGTFIVIGALGLVLTPILLLSIREPKRGRFDPPALQDTPQPPLSESLAFLWNLRSIRYLFAAGACHTFTWCAVNTWNAPFYVRVHGMSLGDVAASLALMNGLGSALGMYMGARLSDYYGNRDPRGRLRVVTIALLAMAPFSIAQYLVSSTSLSLAFGSVALTLMLVYYGPIVAAAQAPVPPNMRAFTSAMLLLVTNLFGLGLGPLAVGFLSDVFMVRYGLATDSLRYAISLAVLFSLLAAWLFWRASSHLARETPAVPAAAPSKALNPSAA
jgi:predicted MFS family arabinose efflux permease